MVMVSRTSDLTAAEETCVVSVASCQVKADMSTILRPAMSASTMCAYLTLELDRCGLWAAIRLSSINARYIAFSDVYFDSLMQMYMYPPIKGNFAFSLFCL